MVIYKDVTCVRARANKLDTKVARLIFLKDKQFYNTIAVIQVHIMVIQVVDYSNGGYNIRKFLPKNQHTERKFMNFENWCNGKLSKIGHNFSNKVI